ncbi:MAG: hypothetical protein LW832_01070 [Parachlamydia sp.]|jgi:hypothetical protein|nr:hypothetical protein [Parachlamydia sp.]
MVLDSTESHDFVKQGVGGIGEQMDTIYQDRMAFFISVGRAVNVILQGR